MGYVPAYEHDIFISYAHQDKRIWIERFLDHLKSEIKPRLGFEPSIWLDDESLRRDTDYSLEIPRRVERSALFLMLPSPSYIRSEYCVAVECPTFRNTIAARRARFPVSEFANSNFALSCPILPVDGDEHRTLFPNSSDIPFCDSKDPFPIGSKKFTDSLNKLVGELVRLLRGMRNHSTPVFVYSNSRTAEITQAQTLLVDELSAQGFRVLPEKRTNLEAQLRQASLSVFLLGERYDETAQTLTDLAAAQPTPWIVWRSREAALNGDPRQLAFARELERSDSPQLTFLSEDKSLNTLKEQVFAPLRPDAGADPAREKPKVYLIYNLKDLSDKANAGSILLHFDKEFQFDLPDDPSLRTSRLMKSDGVLLVWGTADTEWCLTEFQAMLQTARLQNRGLCLFDPQGTKQAIVQEIREKVNNFCITEEFGKFEPARLETFFGSIRQGWTGQSGRAPQARPDLSTLLSG
jgi:hypothetical protein